MTYVDDLFITSTPGLMDAIHNKIKETFSVSSPEKISQDPIEFLGMEISNKKCESSGRDAWMITQQSYTKDLIQKEEQKLKQKKIPLSREWSPLLKVLRWNQCSSPRSWGGLMAYNTCTA